MDDVINQDTFSHKVDDANHTPDTNHGDEHFKPPSSYIISITTPWTIPFQTVIPTTEYEYEPLNTSEECIRLLFLYPKDKNMGIIQGALVAVPLSKRKPYTALSYTWGNTTLSCQMIINGRLYNITKNLAIALEHLQHEEEIVVLFVDAICINQNDTL